MATICYGTVKKLKIDKSLGKQICPNCKHEIKLVLAHEGGYCHICWIPVFPYSGWKVKACPVCGISEKLTKQEFKNLKQAN